MFEMFNGGKLDPFTLMVVQSSEYADRIIKIFDKYLRYGYNPNDIQEQVYREAGVKDFDSDLLSNDKMRIKQQVEAMYKRYH